MPATIDATAHGSSRAMKKIDTPRNPRLRTRAVTSASGRVMAVDSAAKNRVRGIAARTSVVQRQPDQVVVAARRTGSGRPCRARSGTGSSRTRPASAAARSGRPGSGRGSRRAGRTGARSGGRAGATRGRRRDSGPYSLPPCRVHPPRDRPPAMGGHHARCRTFDCQERSATRMSTLYAIAPGWASARSPARDTVNNPWLGRGDDSDSAGPTARPTVDALTVTSAGPVDCRQSTTSSRRFSRVPRRDHGRRVAQPSRPLPSLRHGPRGRRSRPRGPGRRVRDAPRPVRLRQEHDPEPRRRPRRADGRDDPARRSGRHQGAAQRAADGDGLPELRPLSEHDRLREHRLLAEAASAARGRDHRAGHRGGRDARHRRTCSIASRPSCPADSSSASRSGGPSSSSRSSSSSTNRSATSTPRFGPGCAPRSSTSTSRWGRPASS